MLGSTPRFPAFDAWQGMTETERDDLLARIEAAQRRRRALRILAAALVCIATVGAVAVALPIWAGS
jgi:hypothetical protein